MRPAGMRVVIQMAPLLLFPFLAFAQETPPLQTAPSSEETLLFSDIPSVFGASKYEQKVTEAPVRRRVPRSKHV